MDGPRRRENMENERSIGSCAEPSMYNVNLPPPSHLGEAIERIFARERGIMRRPGAFRTYVVGARLTVLLIDGGAPADVDGSLLVALRGLDAEERFEAVVYITDQVDHTTAHVEFRGRKPTAVYRAGYRDHRTVGEFVMVSNVDDRVIVDAGRGAPLDGIGPSGLRPASTGSTTTEGELPAPPPSSRGV
jgi:hypothetical protein